MAPEVAWKIVAEGRVVVRQRVPLDAVFETKPRRNGRGRRARKAGPYWYARVKYGKGDWRTVYIGGDAKLAIIVAAHRIVLAELSRTDLTVSELRRLEQRAYALPPAAIPRLSRMAKGRTIPEAIAQAR